VKELNDGHFPGKDQVGTFVADFQFLRCVGVEVVVAPPFVYLEFVKSLVKPEIAVSAQNCFSEAKGAFTGEVSADQLQVHSCKRSLPFACHT
jgi:triosephosphate isomerase